MRTMSMILMILISVSCKTRASRTGQVTAMGTSTGQWISICSLGKYDKTLYSHDIILQLNEGTFTSQTRYYSDGGCKTKLFQIDRTGSTQSNNSNGPSEDFFPVNITMTLHDASLVKQYNNLSVNGKTWTVDQAQNISPSGSAVNYWGTAQFSSENAMNFMTLDDTVSSGLLFVKQ